MNTAYGHTFKDDKALNAYKKMKSTSRSKALARKNSMTDDEKERAEIRKGFAGDEKRFRSMGIKI